jgi:hypothetical protein
MVKNFAQRKNKSKSLKKRRLSKKIKFVRHSNTKSQISENQTNISTNRRHSINSNDSETEKCINLSFINWTYIFLRNIKCPMRKSNEFIQGFINIIKKLNMKENEFILWTMYIEYYNNIHCIQETWDLEILFYIGIHAKEILGINTDINLCKEISKTKIDKLKTTLYERNFNLFDLNQKYDYYRNFSRQNKNFHYDLTSMVDYICNSNNYKNVKKNKPEKNEETEKNKPEKTEEIEKNKKEKTEEIKKETINKQNQDTDIENTPNVANEPTKLNQNIIEGKEKDDSEEEYNMQEDIKFPDYNPENSEEEIVKLDSFYEENRFGFDSIFYLKP